MLNIPTNAELISNPSLKWQRFCLHPDIWEIPWKTSSNPYSQWKEVKFDKSSIPDLVRDGLDGQEGIYMFIVKPHHKHLYHKDHSYILYIGETNNLLSRFRQYFRYQNSDHPSDQRKRAMVVIWSDFLHFNYIKTSFSSTKKREELEYDLIDSIIPPFNDKFRSKTIKSILKII